jgi:hypothetical protein
MVLSADAVNAQQMLLLKNGVRLTEQNLRMLKSWGVESLYVQLPDEDGADGSDAPANNIDLEQETRARFKGASANPIVAEICRVAAEIVHARRDLEG